MSSSRRRLIRLFLTGLIVVLLAGYGAFTTYFFNPFENDYEFDLATLLPRDIDFFTAKADLLDDFDPFPVPAFAEEFNASRAGQVIQRQAWYQDLLAELNVSEAVASLDEMLAQAPLKLEPLELFGGEDLALAGYFEGSELADARWALLGRTGWMGKFGVELLDRPGWIGLDAQGITAEPVRATIQSKERRVGVTLSGGQLQRPLTIGRVSDVVVVSTDPELVTEVVRLGALRGENSFGLSAKFADRIDVERREGDELEVFVDAVKLSAAMSWTGEWPDRGADTFLPAFLGRLFQVAYVNELAGRLAIQGGLTLDLQGQLSSELLGNTQKRLYRQRHFDKNQARAIARLAPADVGLFVYLKCDVSDILTQALEALDEATIQLFEDLVRDVWGHSGAAPLIDDLDVALQGKVAFFARRADDYAPSELDPPNDGATVLAWALALLTEDAEKLDEIITQIRRKPQAFGLKGLEEGDNGIYNLKSDSGVIVEYMNPLVPGTGEIATLDFELSGDRYFIISNSRQFLAQIDKTFFNVAGASARSLSARPDFEAYVNSGLPSVSALAWVNPRAVGDSLRTIAEENVRVQARSQIDWASIRPGVERTVLKDSFGGSSADSLTQKERDDFESLVEMQLDAIEKREIADSFPRLRQAAHDRIATWEAIKVGLFELALDPKNLSFHSRLGIPLDPPELVTGL